MKGSTYFNRETHIDDPVEIERLTNKGKLLTRLLGGLLPGIPQQQSETIKVLEIGCGPGEWLLDFARLHPTAYVVGLDHRAAMVRTAEQRIKEQHITNASVLFVPAFDQLPLPFANNIFDIISMQCTSLLLLAAQWPSLLSDCHRILHPGGLIRITEFDLAQSNAPAYEEWNELYHKILHMQGHSLSPMTLHPYTGWLFELEPLMSHWFDDPVCIPHIVNFSFGTPFYKEWTKDLNLLICKYLSYSTSLELISSEQATTLQRRIQQEMMLPTFHAIQTFLTVWGRKS